MLVRPEAEGAACDLVDEIHLPADHAVFELEVDELDAELCESGLEEHEDLSIDEGFATISIKKVQARQNIHAQGVDRKMGETIVATGSLISPAELGVAATIGKSVLKVLALPKVCILSSGDELEIDLKAGVVTDLTNGRRLTFGKIPDVMLKILNEGGLLPYIQNHGDLKL